jgi:hypothetical protein
LIAQVAFQAVTGRTPRGGEQYQDEFIRVAGRRFGAIDGGVPVEGLLGESGPLNEEKYH